MRKQVRPPAPDVFQKHADSWNARWVALRAKNPSARFSWYSAEGQTARDWALPALKVMNQGHCSFCDNFPLDAGDHPIEHLRPKTHPDYQHLAYAWENLYYCCTTSCNGFKRERFDEEVLSPDADDFEPLRYFYFDTTTGEVLPHPSASAANQKRAKVTIDLFGLNKDERPKLRRLEIQKWAGQQENSNLNVDDFGYREFLA
ncbi:retron system putative HNH endonuclease [Roseibacillus ishigakijimensis]|uniref:TIGR02646 family protein n=1 Tax=Roseibacillus ishigakijimensis TaxID=454146 RepID=A0A934RM56_9BACT|nr:retron system putative HNH endonuclease [Roseibacillus ishigakijimensis]MBK1833924.1 TIGR02646 family protein [Roseibacillus ishigakijimensis]